MNSFWAAILGTIIGASASIVTVWIQSNAQAKRDRMRLVNETAIAEFKMTLEAARASGRPVKMFPMSVYIHFHNELAKLIERGNIKPADLEQLNKKTEEMVNTVRRFSDKSNKPPDTV